MNFAVKALIGVALAWVGYKAVSGERPSWFGIIVDPYPFPQSGPVAEAILEKNKQLVVYAYTDVPAGENTIDTLPTPEAIVYVYLTKAGADEAWGEVIGFEKNFTSTIKAGDRIRLTTPGS